MGNLWCLAIEHDMTPLGSLFEVEYDDNDSVATLRKKVKEEKPNACKNVDADCLTVWQCKDSVRLTESRPKFLLILLLFSFYLFLLLLWDLGIGLSMT